MSKSLSINALWSASSRIVPLLILFLLTPYIVNSLGVSQYGLYMLVISVSGLMGVMSFGLGDAVLHFIAHYDNLNDDEGLLK